MVELPVLFILREQPQLFEVPYADLWYKHDMISRTLPVSIRLDGYCISMSRALVPSCFMESQVPCFPCEGGICRALISIGTVNSLAQIAW